MIYQVKCETCGSRVNADPLMVGQPMCCPECRENFTIPMTNVAAGLVERDYWIQKSLGTGDVSEMFLAKKLSDNEKILIKVLTPAICIEPAAIQNFTQRMVQNQPIEHPVAVCATAADTISDLPMVVLPYVPGETVEQIVNQEGPYTEKEALKIVIKVARCLRSAWEHGGQIHGAVKPSNIVVDDDLDPHLIEFGNFKSLLLGSSLRFDHLNYGGTVADFMTPEHANGWQLDCRSDIYAMGATLFFMLTGARPFGGGTAAEVLQNHAAAPIPDPCDYNPDLSDEAAELVLNMLAKHPEERIQTWREVVGEIKSVLRAASPGTDTELAMKTQYHMGGIGAPPPKSKMGIIMVLVFGAILLMAIGALGLFHFYTSRGTEPVEPPPGNEEAAGTNGTEPVSDPTALPEDDIIVKKTASIDRFLEHNPERMDFALERFQMLLNQADTDQRKAYVQKRIKKLQARMKNPSANGSTKQSSTAGPASKFRDFAFLGPFDIDKSKTWKLVPAKNPREFPNFKQKFKVGDRTIQWQRYYVMSKTGDAELRKKGTGPKDHVHTYAVARVKADEPTKAKLHLDHDDGLMVWLNGKKVYQKGGGKKGESAEIKLVAGDNVLLLRSEQATGGWFFTLRLTEPDNPKQPAGVRIEAPTK